MKLATLVLPFFLSFSLTVPALALAEQKILPHVDFREAARLATGKAWQGATPEQQERIAWHRARPR